eukprot:gene9034-6335_t
MYFASAQQFAGAYISPADTITSIFHYRTFLSAHPIFDWTRCTTSIMLGFLLSWLCVLFCASHASLPNEKPSRTAEATRTPAHIPIAPLSGEEKGSRAYYATLSRISFFVIHYLFFFFGKQTHEQGDRNPVPLALNTLPPGGAAAVFSLVIHFPSACIIYFISSLLLQKFVVAKHTRNESIWSMAAAYIIIGEGRISAARSPPSDPAYTPRLYLNDSTLGKKIKTYLKKKKTELFLSPFYSLSIYISCDLLCYFSFNLFLLLFILFYVFDAAFRTSLSNTKKGRLKKVHGYASSLVVTKPLQCLPLKKKEKKRRNIKQQQQTKKQTNKKKTSIMICCMSENRGTSSGCSKREEKNTHIYIYIYIYIYRGAEADNNEEELTIKLAPLPDSLWRSFRFLQQQEQALSTRLRFLRYTTEGRLLQQQQYIIRNKYLIPLRRNFISLSAVKSCYKTEGTLRAHRCVRNSKPVYPQSLAPNFKSFFRVGWLLIIIIIIIIICSIYGDPWILHQHCLCCRCLVQRPPLAEPSERTSPTLPELFPSSVILFCLVFIVFIYLWLVLWKYAAPYISTTVESVIGAITPPVPLDDTRVLPLHTPGRKDSKGPPWPCYVYGAAAESRGRGPTPSNTPRKRNRMKDKQSRGWRAMAVHFPGSIPPLSAARPPRRQMYAHSLIC